jgi:hypothetical protein
MCLSPRDHNIVRGSWSWSCCVAQVHTYIITVAVSGALQKMLFRKSYFIFPFFCQHLKNPIYIIFYVVGLEKLLSRSSSFVYFDNFIQEFKQIYPAYFGGFYRNLLALQVYNTYVQAFCIFKGLCLGTTQRLILNG